MNFDKILDAYVECALWSSTDDEGNPLDDSFDASDIEPAALQEMRKDCADFLRQVEEAGLDEAYWQAGENESNLGHDFWLTRNRHDAGFWDRGLGKLGERLSQLAKQMGTCVLFVSGNKVLYVY